jgi:hypothetical protein
LRTEINSKSEYRSREARDRNKSGIQRFKKSKQEKMRKRFHWKRLREEPSWPR